MALSMRAQRSAIVSCPDFLLNLGSRHSSSVQRLTNTTYIPPAPLKLWPYGATQMVLLLLILLLFLAYQHKAAGMKIKLSKTNDHDGVFITRR